MQTLVFFSSVLGIGASSLDLGQFHLVITLISYLCIQCFDSKFFSTQSVINYSSTSCSIKRAPER